MVGPLLQLRKAAAAGNKAKKVKMRTLLMVKKEEAKKEARRVSLAFYMGRHVYLSQNHWYSHPYTITSILPTIGHVNATRRKRFQIMIDLQNNAKK